MVVVLIANVPQNLIQHGVGLFAAFGGVFEAASPADNVSIDPDFDIQFVAARTTDNRTCSVRTFKIHIQLLRRWVRQRWILGQRDSVLAGGYATVLLLLAKPAHQFGAREKQFFLAQLYEMVSLREGSARNQLVDHGLGDL